MIRRSFLAAVALGAACAGVLAGGAALAAGGPATVGSANINPKKLPGTGGTVTVRVKVVPKKGISISSVLGKASSTGGTGFGVSSLLQEVQKNVFQGTVRVGANRSASKAKVNILLDVSTTGGALNDKVIGSVTVDGSTVDPNAPPPPPDI